MKLFQTGPETNSIGELITRRVTEATSIEMLLDTGQIIATSFGVTDSLWIKGPFPSALQCMEIRDDVYLGIKP